MSAWLSLLEASTGAHVEESPTSRPSGERDAIGAMVDKQAEIGRSMYLSIAEPVTLKIRPSVIFPTGTTTGWYRFRKAIFQVLRPSVVPKAIDLKTPP
jgi:hypothetical protein